ncbi:ester cyclase [Spirosoma sp. BT702]|uniref:Ester cyclase n=1 Tax=Spirosoma profusum TaxID=2771354 RepID=A0A927AMQ0_9BACT|nr:ester cyclase [Spirosoma profusum]MBD2700259.1 ester cyclase [Spirosoma profusum]
MRNTTATVLHQWFNKVWNDDDEAAIDKLMTSDSFAHGILTEDQPKGAEGFKLFFRDFRQQFSQVRVDVDDVICQDDMESARTTVNAIHTETGKPVSFSGLCMVRTKDGKIAEAWNNYDFLDLYQQLGQKLTPA